MTSLCVAVSAARQGGPEQNGPDIFTANFLFPPDFIGFNGHFPGNPMLPGVAQIMAAALTVAPDGPARIKELRRTKFVSMVRPGDILQVRVQCRELPEGLLADAQCLVQDTLCAHIKLLLEKA